MYCTGRHLLSPVLNIPHPTTYTSTNCLMGDLTEGFGWLLLTSNREFHAGCCLAAGVVLWACCGHAVGMLWAWTPLQLQGLHC